MADTTRGPAVETGSGANGAHARGPVALPLALRLLNVGPLLILLLLVLVVSALTPNFLKPGNLGNILAQTAVIAIVAMGQQLVILTRGIDLSVGANLALATVMGGLVFRVVDSAPLVMLAMLAAGALDMQALTTHRFPVEQDLEMEMGRGRPAGRTAQRDDLAGADTLAPEDSQAYISRAAAELGAACAHWLAHGDAV